MTKVSGNEANRRSYVLERTTQSISVLARLLRKQLRLPRHEKAIFFLHLDLPKNTSVTLRKIIAAAFPRAKIRTYSGPRSISGIKTPRRNALGIFVHVRSRGRRAIGNDLGCNEWASIRLPRKGTEPLEVILASRHLFPSDELLAQILRSAVMSGSENERPTLPPDAPSEIGARVRETLRGVIAQSDHLGVSTQGSRVLIARSRRFVPDVAWLLTNTLGLDLYSAAPLLRELLDELRQVLGGEGISGAWGKVVSDNDDVWLEPSPAESDAHARVARTKKNDALG